MATKWIMRTAYILVVLGALNLGILGLTNWFSGSPINLINMLGGNRAWLINLLYVLIGVSGVHVFWRTFVK